MEVFVGVSIAQRRSTIRHARRRIMERFGMDLTQRELATILREIRSYDTLPVWICCYTGRSFHPYTIRSVDMVFLYDWNAGCIITVYRKKWFDISDPRSWKLIRKDSRKKTERRGKHNGHKKGKAGKKESSGYGEGSEEGT